MSSASSNSYKRKKKTFPLMLYMQLYLSFTLLLYFFGPIIWKTKNVALTLLLLNMYQLSLGLGYLLGKKTTVKGTAKVVISEQSNNKYVILLITLSIITSILYYIRLVDSTSLRSIWSNILNGLLDPAAQYRKMFSTYAKTDASNLIGGKILSYLLTMLGPTTISSIVLSVVYFKRLSNKYKFLSILNIIMVLGVKLIGGANEGIFDVITYIIVALFIKSQIRNKSQGTTERHKNRILVISVSILLIVLAFNFFTKNINERTGGTFAFPTIGENYYTPNAKIFKYVPKFLHETLTYLTVYLCEGYYGFSLTTMVDWVPNFGIGYSSWIRNNLSDIFDVDLFRYSYQVRVEEQFGWGALRNWHSAYTFWANDFSHLGVIIIMFFFGFLIAKIYYDAIENENSIAMILLTLMIMFIQYLPANNKVFIQPASLLTFWGSMFLWIKNK